MKNFSLICLFLVCIAGCSPTIYSSTRPVNSTDSSVSNENSEFASLMIKDKIDKNQRSAAVINQLLNDQPKDKIAAVVLENKTNCNIIVRISGAKNYILPIYKNDKNFLIVDKGNYIFNSNFCNSKYYKQKNISESVTITLSEK